MDRVVLNIPSPPYVPDLSKSFGKQYSLFFLWNLIDDNLVVMGV